MKRVGVIDGAIGGADRFASVAALFPHVAFTHLGGPWADVSASDVDILIVHVNGGSGSEVEAAIRRLTLGTQGYQTVVTLSEADVTTTRRLVRAGAADVLLYPVSEAALALCLERLLSNGGGENSARRSGSVVALLKAGGGVGATSLAVQMAGDLAKRGAGEVCLADLDLQFGSAAIYFDLPEAVSIMDCLSSDAGLNNTPFATALATHKSGARLLAAPRDVVALESLVPEQVAGLMQGLRRDFRINLIDLPSVWTVWSNQILQEADHIILVTHLTVPHIQLAKRQLRVLAAQGLESKSLTLVCNSLSSDQTASVSLKAAERALGRPFDVVIPEDRKTMTAAINEGVSLSSIKRGTKLEKAIAELSGKVLAEAPAASQRLR